MPDWKLEVFLTSSLTLDRPLLWTSVSSLVNEDYNPYVA